MHVFFDARYIRTDFHDGMSRYSTELGNALAKLTPVTFIISDDDQRAFLPADATYVKIHSTTSALEPLTSLILNKYHPDVVFSPMQTMGSFGRRFKLILTLHDMIYYHHRTPPHALNPFIRLLWRAYHLTYFPQRITLNSADKVGTVSNTVKAEFQRTKLTKRPIVVIPNAPQDLMKYIKKPNFTTSSPQNLVYMGSFMRYKNVEALIAGMEFLPGRTLHLLSRISNSRREQLEKCIPKGAKVMFHNGVSDEKYAQLLANNAAMVSASRDEGYGLPVAEALALGVPAVISDLPIFHEVAGDGALYFGANMPREFADKVKLLDDPERVKALTTAGKKHISKFTWNSSAKILLKTLKSL